MSDTKVMETPFKCVVKVEATVVDPVFVEPWRKASQLSISGSGFAIKGQMILTNSHVVHRNTVLRVRKPGSAQLFVAKLVMSSPELDLALLEVCDKAFWEDMTMVEFASELPKLGNGVTVLGFPVGGNGLSITRGVVSRLCLSEGLGKFLTIQIDAAINSGNSGGPVFDAQANVIGVAFSTLDSHHSQNIGYIISVPVIDLFLLHFHMYGKFMGITSMNAVFQPLESTAGRRALKLPSDIRYGVRVCRVSALASVECPLRVDDVLLSIDGREVAADGTVELDTSRKDERLPMQLIYALKLVGSMIELCVWRKGRKMSLKMRCVVSSRLVPLIDGADCRPKGFIIGGLVFVPVTFPWSQSLNTISCAIHRSMEIPMSMAQVSAAKALRECKEKDDQELMALTSVLNADCNFGYQAMEPAVLLSVNNQKVHNLASLVEFVRENTQELLNFEFEGGTTIVLDHKECKEAEASILENHGIASPLIGLDNVSLPEVDCPSVVNTIKKEVSIV